MGYYKSENPNEQIKEAIENLRRGIAREYSKKEGGNSEYKANKEQLRTHMISTLKVKLNFKDKIFHPSQRRYELTQIARKKDEIKQKNEELISANPRVQLAETIKNALSELGEQEAPVTVFAIEQLLQEPNNMSIPEYINRNKVKNEIDKTNVGIGKLKKLSDVLAKDLQLKSDNISEQFDTNYNKCIYSDNIVTNATTQFGETSQAVNQLKYIHGEIIENIDNLTSQVPVLQNEVLEELDRLGIKTGLDTGFQTFWKNLKENAKKLFNKIFNRNKRNSLPENKSIIDEVPKGEKNKEIDPQKEEFYSRIQNFTPIKQEEHNPKAELEDKELTSNDYNNQKASQQLIYTGDTDKIVKYASAGAKVGAVGVYEKGVYGDKSKEEGR